MIYLLSQITFNTTSTLPIEYDNIVGYFSENPTDEQILESVLEFLGFEIGNKHKGVKFTIHRSTINNDVIFLNSQFGNDRMRLFRTFYIEQIDKLKLCKS